MTTPVDPRLLRGRYPQTLPTLDRTMRQGDRILIIDQEEAAASDAQKLADVSELPGQNLATSSSDGLMSHEDYDKLSTVARDAAPDQTAEEIRDLLENLPLSQQLSATEIRDIIETIDARLGSDSWRTSTGGEGGEGVTLSDDAVLDLIKAVRTRADRGKLIGTSLTDQNSLAFYDLDMRGAIAVTPARIDTYTDVNRTYNMDARGLDVAYLNSKGTDQYEIWYNAETVHTSTGTWTPTANLNVDYTVDTTEETNIGLSATDKLVPVSLVFRASGTFVGIITTWLEIREESGGGVSAQEFAAEKVKRINGDNFQAIVVSSAASLTSALTAQLSSDEPLFIYFDRPVIHSGTRYDGGLLAFVIPRSNSVESIGVFASLVNLDINRMEVASAAQFTSAVSLQATDPHTEWMEATADFTATINTVNYVVKRGDLWYMTPWGTIPKLAYRPIPTDASLSLAQQIGLARHQIQPNVIIGRSQSSISRAYKIISDNAALVTDDVWVQVVVQGQSVGTRDKFDGNHAFTIPTDVGTAVANNLTTEFFEVNVQFWDAATGGTLITTLHLTVEAQAASPAPMVLQAAVNGQDDAGVKSVTLPSNYTDWQEVFIAVWERQDSRSRIATIPTAYLAAQTTGIDIREGGAQMDWVTSSRVMRATGGRGSTGGGLVGGNTIIYAVLR